MILPLAHKNYNYIKQYETTPKRKFESPFISQHTCRQSHSVLLPGMKYDLEHWTRK